MKTYNSIKNQNIYKRLKEDEVLILIDEEPINFTEFIYFLISRRTRGFIIDDYLYQISDKSTLLEALYYQIGLFEMYNFNWDALQEALEYFIGDNNCGIVLIFRNGVDVKSQMMDEFQILEEIIRNINTNNEVRSGMILS